MNLDWRKALRGESSVDSTAKLIGFVLDTYADKHGDCFPSRDTIASGASCDVRTVDQALRRLEARGFVSVQRSKGRAVNRYRLMNPNGEPGSLLGAETTAGHVRRNGESDDTATANVDALNGEPRSPEAGSKPPENQPPNRPPPAAGDSQNGGKPANELPEEAAELLRRMQRGDFVRGMPA